MMDWEASLNTINNILNVPKFFAEGHTEHEAAQYFEINVKNVQSIMRDYRNGATNAQA